MRNNNSPAATAKSTIFQIALPNSNLKNGWKSNVNAAKMKPNPSFLDLK